MKSSELSWSMRAMERYQLEVAWRCRLSTADPLIRAKRGAGNPATPPSVVAVLSESNRQVRFSIDGLNHQAIVCRHGRELHISRNAAVFVFSEVSPSLKRQTTPIHRHAKSSVAEPLRARCRQNNFTMVARVYILFLL